MASRSPIPLECSGGPEMSLVIVASPEWHHTETVSDVSWWGNKSDVRLRWIHLKIMFCSWGEVQEQQRFYQAVVEPAAKEMNMDIRPI